MWPVGLNPPPLTGTHISVHLSPPTSIKHTPIDKVNQCCVSASKWAWIFNVSLPASSPQTAHRGRTLYFRPPGWDGAVFSEGGHRAERAMVSRGLRRTVRTKKSDKPASSMQDYWPGHDFSKAFVMSSFLMGLQFGWDGEYGRPVWLQQPLYPFIHISVIMYIWVMQEAQTRRRHWFNCM